MPPISAAKQKQLESRMTALGIQDNDIVEKFIHASGRGGQNVNKVASCVYLKHLPTGIEVKCQKERSQALNRFLARRLLLDKIEEQIKGIKSARQKAAEKIKRQKRRRSRRAKEKMLEKKKVQSIKKKLRAKPISEE